MKVIHFVFLFFYLSMFGEGFVLKKEGQLNGILSSKGEAWVEIIEDNGLLNRYLAPWHGGSPSRGGGFHSKTIDTFNDLVVGNRVKLDWFWDGHLRVKKVSQIKPFKRAGIFNGILIKKGDKWIDVANEKSLIRWRFYARWKGGRPESGGEYNPETLEFFDNFKIDDQISFAWSYDFRPRIDRFILQEKQEVFVPFYEGKSIPGSQSILNTLPTATNPFDQVKPSLSPFEQVPTLNPFEQGSPTSNPFDQANPTPVNPFETETPNSNNPFDTIDGKGDVISAPIEVNPFDSLPDTKPVEENPFKEIPLPGNPFEAIPKIN